MPALSVIQMGNVSSTEAVRLPFTILRPTCIFLAHKLLTLANIRLTVKRRGLASKGTQTLCMSINH